MSKDCKDPDDTVDEEDAVELPSNHELRLRHFVFSLDMVQIKIKYRQQSDIKDTGTT